MQETQWKYFDTRHTLSPHTHEHNDTVRTKCIVYPLHAHWSHLTHCQWIGIEIKLKSFWSFYLEYQMHFLCTACLSSNFACNFFHNVCHVISMHERHMWRTSRILSQFCLCHSIFSLHTEGHKMWGLKCRSSHWCIVNNQLCQFDEDEIQQSMSKDIPFFALADSAMAFGSHSKSNSHVVWGTVPETALPRITGHMPVPCIQDEAAQWAWHTFLTRKVYSSSTGVYESCGLPWVLIAISAVCPKGHWF